MSSTPLEVISPNQECVATMLRPSQQSNPYAGFDPHAGVSWLYPVDSTTPEYLPSITEKALHYNSLVVLPNKFEKSFLAAVTMYNIYRWYPLGKVIYVAPKRSFIAEQMAACENLVKFPTGDLVDMVFKPNDRLLYWMSKRIFFITSHMLLCDITRAGENLPLEQTKLIVIDEPQLESRLHVKILQQLAERNANFRVICLSLTSSKTIDAAMLKHWLISSIELQWGNPLEAPEDWLMNKKEISNIATPVGISLQMLLDELRDIGQCYTKNLHNSKLCKAEFETINVRMVRQQRDKYEKALLTGVLSKNHHELMLNFHLAERTLVGYSILKRDGIIAILDYFHKDIDILVQGQQKLVSFLDKLRQGVYNTPHPKFRTLENFLREFFKRRLNSKVLVVVESISSALIVADCLGRIPSCKHKVLMGGNYMQDVQSYCNGELDVLIVTIAAEPAISLCATDLIVLFNVTDNPRDFLAHIARTRGANPGAIVMLTTEGSEQLAVDEVISTRRKYFFENRTILPIGVDLSNEMMQSSPSIIPPGFQPKRRHAVFNLKAGNEAVVELDVEYPLNSSQPQAGEKRKIVEVLSGKPAAYDLSNGQAFYEVVPIKQQAIASIPPLLLSEECAASYEVE
ncbi:Fanconi anemia group M protein homolog [Wyeomyia smithii]|uniref:Fanconi anemia group M protein homolog n=1 Tax=Wyeomyia smithii TaxID=174621 RepID=UPI002467DD72|nr:Fanconi anemia group M protein homolog [Wyeomyia smithii]